MNERALKTLEYNKIIDRLAALAGSALGREKCEKLLPSSDLEEIRRMQQETSDALARIYQKGSLSFSGIPDIRASIMRLKIGGTLGPQELLRISSLLTAALRAKNYGTHKEDAPPDSLSERFSMLEPLSGVNNEIRRCILSEEEIADDASAALKSIRRAIRAANDKIRDELNSIVNSQQNRAMLQDSIVTMRNGRYCLPVKSEYKNQFGGMIHDQSATGSTLFIEPMAVVRLNNELRELALKEQSEIEKILAELSAMAGAHTEELAYNQTTLAEFDFIFARALLSRQMKASEPVFTRDRVIDIKKGRHPLIDPRRVVPIDIRLGQEFDLLVITGPNTGGKTVSLKTVGLFTLMGQAGLHIPAFDGSKLGVFREVYADIGDEQSIEQSLSTFSSHMTNTVSILKEADENSLALFDELGAGTDPTEGAALAMAILSYLHSRGIRTMATTHYSELKVFALSTEGVSNACCEFDVATLRPTYRLLIGIPGKSNAFAISSKLGLPDSIIEDAKARIGTQDKTFEDLLSELDQKRIETEREYMAANEARAEAEKLKKRLAEKNDRIDRAKDRILREANENAREILQGAKDYADEVIRKYNKWSTQGGLGKEMEAERSALRDKLGDTDDKLAVRTGKKGKGKKEASPEDFKVGDTVMVLSLNLKGTVSTPPNAKGDLYVQMGVLRSLVNIKDLEHVQSEEEPKEKKSTQAGKIQMSKTLSISPELNLIGKRVDEALPILDKYLDDAYLAHLPKVTIIHGRGTGALRDAVQAHLKRTKYVKSFRIGGFGEGDHGVTIVEFK
ncbi:MAG TPA: endonuclease MutS2 [Candidatus Caccomorpha excrementavium]|nr:endonuclease MutS2 [Candidatus Caccomorpha excrementavium]